MCHDLQKHTILALQLITGLQINNYPCAFSCTASNSPSYRQARIYVHRPLVPAPTLVNCKISQPNTPQFSLLHLECCNTYNAIRPLSVSACRSLGLCLSCYISPLASSEKGELLDVMLWKMHTTCNLGFTSHMPHHELPPTPVCGISLVSILI